MSDVYTTIINVISAILVFFFSFGWVIILVLFSVLKRVPNNTVLIIDRNSHYHKTKKRGFYTLGPQDKITSKISTDPVIESYSNIFSTHDSEYYSVDFMVTYSCENIDSVINSLQDSRRSIYDIINCAMEITIKSFQTKDLNRNYQYVSNAAKAQIESMLEPFYIDVTFVKITKIQLVNQEYGKIYKFEKHESRGDMPIKD